MISLRALVIPLAAATAALAAPALAGGTSEQRSACMSDAFKFCSGDIPDESAIESCLRRNGPRLSSSCQVVMGVSTPGEATTRHATRSIRARSEEPAVDQPVAALASTAGDSYVADGERPSRGHRSHRHAHQAASRGGFGVSDLAAMAGPAMAMMPAVASMFQDGGLHDGGLGLDLDD